MGIRFTDAVAALVAAYQAAPALAGVPVSDRMDYTIPDRAPDFIIVGHDATTTSGGVLQADALAGTFLREWSDTTTGRDETGSVNCLIACQSADVGAVAACSTRAAALLGAAEDAALAARGVAPDVRRDDRRPVHHPAGHRRPRRDLRLPRLLLRPVGLR